MEAMGKSSPACLSFGWSLVGAMTTTSCPCDTKYATRRLHVSATPSTTWLYT